LQRRGGKSGSGLPLPAARGPLLISSLAIRRPHKELLRKRTLCSSAASALRIFLWLRLLGFVNTHFIAHGVGIGPGSDKSVSAAAGDPELRRAYQRLKFRRVSGVAKLAIARRLAVRLYWMRYFDIKVTRHQATRE